ncbi:hypothetical protein HK101_006119 [Irineochytrium annulatum]|nr:hypothetical protein HK101_006119 [Irineochytrium annulatum]
MLPSPVSPVLSPVASPKTTVKKTPIELASPELLYAKPASGQRLTLLHLPSELLIAVAMKSGFFGGVNLMRCCRRLNHLLDDPASWIDYNTADPGSLASHADLIESEVTIQTKIHTYDHLVFGLWHDVENEGGGGAAATDKDGAPVSKIPRALSDDCIARGSTRRSSTETRKEPRVYFEHMAFSDSYDYLGGVSLHLARGGQLNSAFFDHRETLPCYRAALDAAVASGQLAPSAPHGGPPAGAKVDHTCGECAGYDGREVLKSLFVFEQVPSNPRWGREGFSWSYDYPDGRRRLRVAIVPYQGQLGYTSVRDLPTLFLNHAVTVNGRKLTGSGLEMFQRLVNGKEDGRKQ